MFPFAPVSTWRPSWFCHPLSPTHYEPMWIVMFQKHQLFCFWTLAHKIFRVCSPSQGLSKNIKFWVGGPQFWGNLDQSSSFQPPYLLPQGVLGAILVWGDVWPMGLLKFQNWGTWPPPLIFGDFSPKIFGFSTLTPGFSLPRHDFFSRLACRYRGPRVVSILKKSSKSKERIFLLWCTKVTQYR